jgi:predicted nucleic acid-binding protein
VTGFVLDCSIAIAWCFADESTPESDALLDRVRAEGAMVPSLWQLEVGNVLLTATRRGRLSQAEAQARLEALAVLPIAIDGATPHRAWREVVALARMEHLTVYDACYLELAIRYGLPLATKDRALQQAARNVGIEMLPA